MTAYSKLAKLPPPTMGEVAIPALVERNAALEQRLAVRVVPGPDLSIPGDADQLDQVLVNLIGNATDAVLERDHGEVKVTWARERGGVLVSIDDNGPGVASTDNLFVPFFTTKPEGNGIGLVLSRQIAEAHGGTLDLVSREEGGARARLWLPTSATAR
jgi:signal transduction histidine kinase